MRLREQDLAAYAALVAPDKPEAEQKLRERIESGKLRLEDIRVTSTVDAAVRVAPVGPQTVVLVGPVGTDPGAAELVPDAIARAREIGAIAISTRPRAKQLGPEYRAALVAAGFEDRGERVEFKTDVADLPSDDGSPLTWRNLDDVGHEFAAAMLAKTAKGDPHGLTDDEDPAATLSEYLADTKLLGEPRCVQIGYEDDGPVAFVCAQVGPDDGWSRITYMGLVPAARGRGLGRWIHRRGFTMMKEQDGKLYHGGTATSNASMVKLFHAHGCKEVERMFDFEWRA